MDNCKSQVVTLVLVTAIVSSFIVWEMSVSRVATECDRVGAFLNKEIIYICKRKGRIND